MSDESELIPFTQYLRPHGRSQQIYADRPEPVLTAAKKFIAAGGRFECEVLTTGAVSLSACICVNDEMQDIAIVITPNGPEVPAAIDRLVHKAEAYLTKMNRDKQ